MLTNTFDSPAAAKEAGIFVTRELYSAGEIEILQELQRYFGVKKLFDVPDSRGHEFFAHVLQLKNQLGQPYL